MRLEQDVGDDRLGSQVLPLAIHARVQVRADVAVGPAIEAAILHGGEVVGHQVIAQPISLIHRCPQLVGDRVEGEPDRVPRTPNDQRTRHDVQDHRDRAEQVRIRVGGDRVAPRDHGQDQAGGGDRDRSDHDRRGQPVRAFVAEASHRSYRRPS